jgi:hypothetical protein
MIKLVIFMFFCLVVFLFSCVSKKTESGINVKDTTLNSASPSEVNSTDATDGEGSPAIGKTVSPGNVRPVTISFLGFSPDLKYVAFDVIESSWAEVDGGRFVIQVDQNDFVAQSRFTELDGEISMEAIRENGVDMVKDYNINGTNLGTRIVLDSTRSENEIRIDKKLYTLRLVQKPAPNKGAMFELHLLHDADIHILQKDKRRPDSRGMAASYYLKEAWVNGGKIAIFILYDSEPFEVDGINYKDRRCIMVTGVIK